MAVFRDTKFHNEGIGLCLLRYAQWQEARALYPNRNLLLNVCGGRERVYRAISVNQLYRILVYLRNDFVAKKKRVRVLPTGNTRTRFCLPSQTDSLKESTTSYLRSNS